MANKKLGTTASDLKLPAQKAKGEKKPKWQAKTGGKKTKAVEGAELGESAVEMPTADVEQPQEVKTPAVPRDEITTEPAPTVEPVETLLIDEPTPAKPKKLKVQADLKPKKLSMIKAALKVLQERMSSRTQGADDLPRDDRRDGHSGPVGFAGQ